MSRPGGSSIPAPRIPGMARSPTYASVASGRPGSGSFQHSRNSSQFGASRDAFHIASTSYPAPQPLQSQHRNSDVAELYNTSQDNSQSWDKKDRNSITETYLGLFGSGMMDNRMSDFFVPSYLRNSRYLERLHEKQKAKAAAQMQPRDNKSGSSSRVGSLSTTPSSMNLHRAGFSSYRGVMHDVQEKAPRPPEETLRPLPIRWSHIDRLDGLELSGDGLQVNFNGEYKKLDDAAASVRADSPVPRECGIYYYEATVIGKIKDNQVGLGFSEARVRLDKLPGWEPGSWAYHADDGFSFCQTTQGKPYGPKFAYSDVVGCGINFKTGQVFYTRNGVHLGVAYRDLKVDGVYFPTVGMTKPGEHIKANFGQEPFVYDIDGLVARERQTLQDDIDATSLKQQIGHGSEASLLQEIIAQYLTHEGFTETGRAFDGEVRKNAALLAGTVSSLQNVSYKEDMDSIHRQRIRSAVIDGDIEKALNVTNAFYPKVFPANPSIYFKLRCQRFIEMIRKCTALQPQSKRRSMHASSSSDLRGSANGYRNSMHNDNGYPDVFGSRLELDEAPDAVTTTPGEATPTMSEDSVAKQNELVNQALQYGQELRAEFRDIITKQEQSTLDQTFALIAYPDARDSSLAYLLDVSGRAGMAEELNSAILVGLGKASASAIERLVQQAEVLVSDLSTNGGSAALINVRKDYMLEK